ncbi:alginate export family protein [Sphingomonas sp. ABOLE]|uniref:alginate export family protein n=1 Tax=Sphingomonas sp. ABOLE TaxID=1985878 RepID=UPI001F4941AE|nr:alginate export family protein [Sphingomonas sp. ABOLE]
MSRSQLFLPLVATIGLSLGAAPAFAQTEAAIEPAALLVIAEVPQDGPQQSIPPQKSTPPAEAVTPRAPSSPATFTYPSQADGFGIKLGGYNTSRWAEDWRGMRNPKKRDDPLDRLKYLPIAGDGLAYVTLSGEIRLREQLVSQPGLSKGPHREEQLLRIFAGADVHVGPLRAYGELAHGGLSGYNIGTPAGKSRNDLFAQQYFVELSGTVLPGVSAGVRYGRQEFTDGAPGLISVKDDNSMHTELNGGRAWVSFAQFRADLFDFKQTTLGLGGSGDDRIDDGTRFSGVTFGVVLANQAKRKIFFDPFFWRERNDMLKWGKTSGVEIRHYYGARLWGSMGKLTFDWLVNHQGGDLAGRPIDAWFLQAAQTYSLSKKGLKPKPGIHFDYGSGGGAYGSGTIRNTRVITAGSIAYSYQLVLGLSNLFQVSPNVTISPSTSLDLTAELQHSLRVDATDAVYRGAGTAYAGTQLVKGAHVGDAARLQATWKVSPRVSVIGRYEYFEPGAVLKAVGSKGSHFLAGWISLRF